MSSKYLKPESLGECSERVWRFWSEGAQFFCGSELRVEALKVDGGAMVIALRTGGDAKAVSAVFTLGEMKDLAKRLTDIAESLS